MWVSQSEKGPLQNAAPALDQPKGGQLPLRPVQARHPSSADERDDGLESVGAP